MKQSQFTPYNIYMNKKDRTKKIIDIVLYILKIVDAIIKIAKV
jgi:hypothetical protein